MPQGTETFPKWLAWRKRRYASILALCQSLSRRQCPPHCASGSQGINEMLEACSPSSNSGMLHLSLWHLHKSLTLWSSWSLIPHTFPEPCAWTSAHLVQRWGHRDESNSLFSSQEVLILLLRQPINTSKHVSLVETGYLGEQVPQATPSYQCTPSSTPCSVPSLTDDHGLS